MMQWKDVVKLVVLVILVAILAFLSKLFFWKLVLV